MGRQIILHVDVNRQEDLQTHSEQSEQEIEVLALFLLCRPQYIAAVTMM